MKLAVAGKGGVGKTTLAAALARGLAAAGQRVLAVDADPNNCLGAALGFSAESLAALTPISRMRELLTERAGISDGGGFFALNPPVTDLLPRFSLTQDGISLLVMGTVERPGGGCVCPESSVLRALTRHLVGLDDTALVMDLEAGLEHLGRGTAQYMDRLLIVTEPTPASVRTTRRIAELAAGLGLRTVAVGNKIRDAAAAEFVRAGVAPIPLAGLLPYDPVIEQAYRSPTQPSAAFSAAIGKLLAGLEGSS